MPFEPIPFTSMDLSVDKASELASYGQVQYDGYWKRYHSPEGPKLIWVKRPGLTAWADTTDTNDVWDIFYAIRTDNIIVVLWSSGEVFKIAVSTGTASEITGTAAMSGTIRPSFVEAQGGSYVYLATGGVVGRYPTASGTGAALSDADAPTTVNSIATISQSLIAQRVDSRRFDWSDSGDFTAWAGSYANCSVRPGYTNRVFAADNYLWFFREDDIEVWRDDGSTFIRETQGSIEGGCRNEASIRFINGSFYFIDNNLNVRRLTGFNRPEIISNPYLSGYISTITDYQNVEGHYLNYDGKDFYLLQFWGSSSNVPCLVYDIELSQWYRWGYYTAGAYQRWPISGICTANNGIWYAGDYNLGKVHKITGTTDLGDDIYSRVRTDFVDRGAPDTYKYCHEITIIMKKSSTSATAKNISIRYRDDGTQTWSTAQTAAIEAASTTELKVNLRRLGRYKRRQWEFLISDATVASIVSVWERYSVGS